MSKGKGPPGFGDSWALHEKTPEAFMGVRGRLQGVSSLYARIIDGDFDAVPFLAKRKDIDALFVHVRPFFFFGRDVGDRVGPAAEEAGDRYPCRNPWASKDRLEGPRTSGGRRGDIP